jgi:hypothetical protein
MTQMDADEGFLFFKSALICVICGQLRIRLRLGALGNPWSILLLAALPFWEIRG